MENINIILEKNYLIMNGVVVGVITNSNGVVIGVITNSKRIMKIIITWIWYI